ncbi:MAG: hypothetical protein GXP27_06220 [Planctomycetes bacterium]|nr:hypothetical protein [Planctomycetota bacterium]
MNTRNFIRRAGLRTRFAFLVVVAILWQLAPARAGAPSGTSRSNAIFRAGAAAVDITPKKGVSLDGVISKPGPARDIHDPLHARALVLDDGQTRLAIVVADLCMIDRETCDQAKAAVYKRTGLPTERVLISAVHTHAAPRVRFGRRGPIDDEYYRFFIERVADAVQKAIANLQPAKVGWGSFEKPEYVRCRRLLCKPATVGPNPFGETGERVRSVAGKGGEVIGPAGPVDPQVFVLSVQHSDGCPLAVLANFSVHYCGGYRRGLVSADYFGYFAGRLQERLLPDASHGHPPFVGIMSNGTSGNTSNIQTGGRRYKPFEWMQISGRILADETAAVVQRASHEPAAKLVMHETDLELSIRRPDAKRLEWARQVLSNPRGPHPHPWTVTYAREALALSQYPATRPVKVQAIGIHRTDGSELGIAAIACEVFAETGLAIKADSPFPSTFTIALANGEEGYLPPPKQHQWGGYEAWPARSSCLEVQAEPKIRKAALQLLEQCQHRSTE